MKNHITAAAVIAAAALTLSSTAAHAVRKAFEPEWHPLLGTSITGGGETLVKVEFTNGSSQSIRSGGLVHLFGGVEYISEDFAVQGNIGYHVDNSTASNGDVRFSRFPIELIGFWKYDDTLRWGVGLRKATGPKINSSGAATVSSPKFGSKIGVILQGEYFFQPKWSVLLRAVREDYTVEGGNKVQGNHIGLGTTYRF